jgi:hypothetical protein
VFFKSRSNLNYVVDISLLLLASILIYSGLKLQIDFHITHLSPSIVNADPEYQSLRLIHIISASSGVVFFILHIVLHLSWYKAFFAGKSLKNKTHMLWLSAMAFLCITFGMASFLKSLAMTSMNDEQQRKMLMEIHDKFGVLVSALLLYHVIIKTRWLINRTQRLINGQ